MKKPMNIKEALELAIKAMNQIPSFDTGIFEENSERNLSSYKLLPILEMALKNPSQTSSRKKYNHAYTIGFLLENNDPDGFDNTTAQEIRDAILLRLARLNDDELFEAVGPPFDTYKQED